MSKNNCHNCFNKDVSPLDDPCASCFVDIHDGTYSHWISVTVFKNIDNTHGEAMVKRQALEVQVAGDHYKKHGIQPVEYIHTNNIGYFEGNVIKYVTRWRDKGGIADLEKAKHYIELLIELEGKQRG